MEKSQSPAQQQMQQTQQLPLQLLPDQFQQFVNAYAAGQPTIQVKQEYATQQQPQGISAADLKSLQDAQNHQLQQMQIVQAEAPQSPHQNSQNALQQAVQSGQMPAEYLQQRVQVLQQPLQNAQYLTQQMYSPQLVMSAGNLLAHSGLGQQPQIQLIAAAGKQFQNQLTPQMLTTTGGKPVLTTGAQGFSSYTIPSTSQPQTLLFSPVTVNGVLGNAQQQQQSNQQQIMSTMQSQNTPTKNEANKNIGQKVVQKVNTQGTNNNQQQHAGNNQQNANNQQQQCVQVSQTMPTAQILSGQTMQFAAPWQLQGMAPFWTTANGLQPQTLVANPIFIRGTNPDGTPMLFQQSPQTQTTQQTVQSPHNRKRKKFENFR